MDSNPVARGLVPIGHHTEMKDDDLARLYALVDSRTSPVEQRARWLEIRIATTGDLVRIVECVHYGRASIADSRWHLGRFSRL
jgi:hypothetical protein